MLIWRVNVASHTLRREPAPGVYDRLGGRGLLAQILVDESRRHLRPAGPGQQADLCARPAGGPHAVELRPYLRRREEPADRRREGEQRGGPHGPAIDTPGHQSADPGGRAGRSGLWVLRLDADGAEFEPAGELAGLGVYETARRLYERYGPKVAVALIGPGGEMRMSAAGIQNVDKERVPSRINARGGLGAVMAAEGPESHRVRCERGGEAAPSPTRRRSGPRRKLTTRRSWPCRRPRATRITAPRAWRPCAMASAACPRGTFPPASSRRSRRSAATPCAICCCAAGAQVNLPMPVWPAARFAVPTSSAGKMERRSCRRWSTRRSA